MTFRLAIMADRPLGRSVLDYLLRKHPDDLAAIVLVDEAAWKELPSDLMEHCSERTERLTWRQRSRLREMTLHVLLLAGWPHLLKAGDLDLAPRILNMHPSFLPHCRGVDSHFWAIVERRPFGVTIHHVKAAVDAGAIAFQRRIPITWEDTGETLYRAEQREIVALLNDSYAAIAAGHIPAIPQELEEGSLHFRRELDPRCALDLDAGASIRDVLNLLRARTFPPHPACTFVDGDGKYEVRINIRKL